MRDLQYKMCVYSFKMAADSGVSRSTLYYINRAPMMLFEYCSTPLGSSR